MHNPILFGMFRRELPLQEEDTGLYSSFKVAPFSAQLFARWGRKYKVPNVLQPDEMHSTVVYSPRSFQGYTPWKDLFYLDPATYEWVILGDSENPALVLKYYHPIPHRQFDKATLLGAESKYPKYIPHITLSYQPEDFDNSKLPLPDFSIALEDEEIRPARKSLDEAFLEEIHNDR